MSVENISRETGKRVFASEFNDIELELDNEEHLDRNVENEDRSPNYHLLPTGEKVNRVICAGALVEVDEVNESSVRARITDHSDTYFLYAHQNYEADMYMKIKELESPEHVVFSGKVNSFENDDGDTLVSIRPEWIATTTNNVRDRWTLETVNRTLERIKTENNLDNLAEEIGHRDKKYLDTVEEAIEELKN